MKIKLITLFFIVAFGSATVAQQSKLNWYTSVFEASAASIKTGKPVFAFFTGSDWCGWCMKLHANVLSKDAFITWAQKNVVLLELDFPRRKQLSPELTKQNNDMQQTFKVSGFPTVWLFTVLKDAKTGMLNFTPVGSLGYPTGAIAGKEEEKFLSNANAIMGLK